MREFDLTWLEEPVSPPGDHAGLARVRREGGVPIAAGENAAGLHDFHAQFEAGAVDVAQPSVIKIGGPSAMLEIAALAKAFGVRVVPHNAYFGPGFLASLHVNATIAPDAPFERLFVDLEASPLHDLVVAKDGKVTVPDGPGLGRDPDMDVLRRYLVEGPTLHRASGTRRSYWTSRPSDALSAYRFAAGEKRCCHAVGSLLSRCRSHIPHTQRIFTRATQCCWRRSVQPASPRRSVRACCRITPGLAPIITVSICRLRPVRRFAPPRLVK